MSALLRVRRCLVGAAWLSPSGSPPELCGLVVMAGRIRGERFAGRCGELVVIPMACELDSFAERLKSNSAAFLAAAPFSLSD